MSDNTPRRRYDMHLHLGADSMEDLCAALRDLATQLLMYRKDLKEDYHMVSGGPHDGYSVDILFDPDMSHEKYHDAINEWIKERDEKSKGEPPSPTPSSDPPGSTSI